MLRINVDSLTKIVSVPFENPHWWRMVNQRIVRVGHSLAWCYLDEQGALRAHDLIGASPLLRNDPLLIDLWREEPDLVRTNSRIFARELSELQARLGSVSKPIQAARSYIVVDSLRSKVSVDIATITIYPPDFSRPYHAQARLFAQCPQQSFTGGLWGHGIIIRDTAGSTAGTLVPLTLSTTEEVQLISVVDD